MWLSKRRNSAREILGAMPTSPSEEGQRWRCYYVMLALRSLWVLNVALVAERCHPGPAKLLKQRYAAGSNPSSSASSYTADKSKPLHWSRHWLISHAHVHGWVNSFGWASFVRYRTYR